MIKAIKVMISYLCMEHKNNKIIPIIIIINTMVHKNNYSENTIW